MADNYKIKIECYIVITIISTIYFFKSHAKIN
jgi:hypothetical protein